MDTQEETIITVDIDDFRKYKEKTEGENVDYVDEFVLVARNIENLPYSNRMIRLNLFIIVSCIEGQMQLTINRREYRLQAGEAFVCLPTTILSNMLLSPQHRVSIVGFSTKFLQQVLKQEKAAVKALYYLYKNPVFDTSFTDKEKGDYNLYIQLILDKIGDSSHRYRQEILKHLFSALFHEMLASIQRHSDETEDIGVEIIGSRRIFKQFMEELAADGGLHRSVSYFADRLCYSAKYISSVVKEVSGRTPTEWINEYAIEQIKYHLKHSDKSVKEIAEMLDFPNQSFFGKYVKTHLGMSPARYRAYSNDDEPDS